MQIKKPENRLRKFYGEIAHLQNQDIIKLIAGKTVLDIGCGYGTLVHQIKKEKPDKMVVGIDVDKEAIRVAKEFYGVEVKQKSVFEMDFSDGYFDTVILRDAIHHFSHPDELRQVLKEINRVSAKELIIFDPNPNPFLLLCRKIIGHKDGQMPLCRIKKALEDNGFKVMSCYLRDVLAMPLSGGFVGIEFVPNIKLIKTLVVNIDSMLNFIFYRLKVQNLFCWRYLIYAVKQQ